MKRSNVEPWAQPAQLIRKIRHQVKVNKTAPARFYFTESNYANAAVVMEQLEHVVRDGWWTADEIHELTPMQERVLRLVLRVKLGLEDFRGQLTAASIAHYYHCKDPRGAQLAIKKLEELELIQTERRLRAIVSIGVNNWFFTPEPPRRRRRSTGAGAPEVIHSPARHRAERAPKTKNNSDHVLSKGLSSERTPYPLLAEPPPPPPGVPPSTPNGHDTEERKRRAGYADSPRSTNGNDDRTATAQGIQRHSGILILTVPASTLSPPQGRCRSPGGSPGAGGARDHRRRPEALTTS